MSVLPINSKTLLFTAETAKRWHVFPHVSKMLINKCTTFLAKEMKTAEDVCKLMLDTKESCPDADPDLLQELLRMNAKNPKTCPNCKRGLAHCVHGQHVTGLENPPVVAKGVVVRPGLTHSTPLAVEGLQHYEYYTTQYEYEPYEPYEVDNFPKTGDPRCFGLRLTNNGGMSMVR